MSQRTSSGGRQSTAAWASDAQRLKVPAGESRRLTKPLAESMLDVSALKDRLRKNWYRLWCGEMRCLA
jgi:hypothetical protein